MRRAAAEKLSGFELTRSDYGGASSLSAEHYGGNIMDNCNAWTDERHNKYLNSLEASFVQQLHQSRGMLASRREHNRIDKGAPHRSPVSLNKASEQCSHKRDGGWEKKILEKNQPHYIQMHYQEVSEGSGQNFVDENCDKKVEDSCGRYLDCRSRNSRN